MAYETEYELETELEGEFEGEFEGEAEFEGEFEGESEVEGEGWLGAIGNVVGSLLGESEGEFEFEAEFEGEFEGESESEGEFEGEGEFESEINPIRKIYPDAMMEHLGELAAESETEQEAAEHFLPLIGMAASKLLPVVAKAVLPLAKKALPRIAKAISRVTPRLTKGVGKIARGLHRNPQTRHLLRAIPSVARRTVGNIAKQAARGQRVTPGVAVKTLARQAKKVLGTPRHRKHALRRHHALERRLHGRWGRGMVRPHYRWGRVAGRAPAGYGGQVYAAPAAVAGAPQRVVGGVPVSVRPGGVRYGQVVGGKCVCSSCPSCGAVSARPAVAVPAPVPAYCRCCGQVLR
jgi:hypothetical protein